MNNNFGIANNSFSLIITVLKEFTEINSARFFGSRAKGDFKKGSDIDIAIYGENLSKDTSFNLSAKLNENTPIPYFVDVVAPKYLSSDNLIDHINRIGITFYTKEVIRDL